MRLPKLPPVVRLILDEHHEWTQPCSMCEAPVSVEVPKCPKCGGPRKLNEEATKGAPLPDVPVFVCRPVTALEKADAGAEVRANSGGGYARLGLSHLLEIERLTMGPGDEPFDRGRQDHVDALDGAWLVELGVKLTDRTTLTEAELGKSSSPSESD